MKALFVGVGAFGGYCAYMVLCLFEDILFELKKISLRIKQ